MLSPSSNFLLSLSLIHSSTQAINEADEQSPCLISSSNPLLSISKDLKRSSTILLHTFLCLPLRGLIFHSWLNSCFGYLSSGKVASLYHHFNFALSLRLCNVSKPMSPLTASLQVLEEHPRIHLAPSNIMDSKEPAWLLLPSHTSLPYSIPGLITDNNKCLRALKLIFLLVITLCSWFTLFLPLSNNFLICISQAPFLEKINA